jgi:PAS domain S-box-containing protein
VLVGLGLWWKLDHLRHSVHELAETAARSSFEKDLLYRQWAALHGGVYVPVTDRSPPNPLLSGIPERDLTTPSGRALTLMNPAYMTRQVHELGAELYRHRGHITSLQPIRAENAPDAWERQALEAFARGVPEVSAVESFGGEPHLRFMRPLRTEAGCLKCHAAQGYKLGDIRGGISVAVPMRDYEAVVQPHQREEVLAHSSIWILGLVALGAGGWQLQRRRRERDVAGAAMRESRQRLEFALDGGHLGLWDWQPQTGAVVYSELWARMLEYTLDEIEPTVDFFRRHVHPEDLPAVLERLTSHVEGRSPVYESEHRLRAKSGRWVWVLDRGKIADRDGNGRVLRVTGVISDITERKRNEEALKGLATSFAQLSGKAFFEAICRHVATVLEVDFVFVGELNRTRDSVSALGGYARGEAMGELTYSLADTPCQNVVGGQVCVYPSAVQARFPQDLLLAQMGIEGYVGAPILDKRHEPLGLMVALHSQPFANPQAIVSFFNVFLDRVSAEMQRAKAEAALRASEEKYRGLIDSSPVGYHIYALDGNGRLLFVMFNEAADTILQVSHAQFVGREILEAFPGLAGTGIPEMYLAVARGELETQNFELPYDRGDIRGTFEVRVFHGAPGQAVVNFVDISERRRLEEQLRQAQKMEAIGQLAGGVAHDFNNILASLTMGLELLRDAPSLDHGARAMLKDLSAETKRASNLTRQLLMFSRRSVLDVQVLDLNEVIANLLKMLGRLLGEDITLVFERRSQLPTVEADTGMLEQVLMNLVVNARDAMPGGGKIILGAEAATFDPEQAAANPDRRPGRFVGMTISDTGCGMDAATLQRIFEPFFTTKEAGKGTGLGLATVHGIAAQHKGWVEVESAVGRGTTFRVYLPASTKAVVAPMEREAAAVPRGKETLLVVEDDASVRERVVQTLRVLGYRVIAAANGQEAMTLWREHGRQVDLLLTDMVMPEGMTGLELAERVRLENPGLRVILSSGYSAEITQADQLATRGILYLPKPYEVAQLAADVRRCLDAPPIPP